MHIISKGQVPGQQLYQVNCPNCRTMFQFFRHEATERSMGQIDPPVLEIMCPLDGCMNICSTPVKKPDFGRTPPQV